MLSTKYKVFKFIAYGIIAIVLCVLQNTPGLFVLWGIKPMLVVAFAVCVTLFEKETAGGLVGMFCGLLCDFFSSYTFGFYALALFVCCVLVGLLTQGYMRPVIFNAVLFTMLAITLIQWAGFFFTIFIWDEPGAMDYLWTRIMPMCFYTAATAPLFYYPVRALHLYFEGLIASA